MKKRSNKKNSRNNIIIISLICMIASGLLSYFTIYLLSPKVIITGNDIEVVEVLSEYQDKGAKAYVGFNNEFNVKTKNNVDTSKIGKYTVLYTAYIYNKKYISKRIVKVVDTTKPDIKLNGNKEVTVCRINEYQDEGVMALDNYDGDITDSVIKKIDNNIIEYTSIDSSNNSSTISRTLIIDDIEKPIITLAGTSSIKIYKGNNYEEIGYKAFDNCDGDLTANVNVTNNIDINSIGKYKVLYEVTDNKGNIGTIERTVEVVDKPIYNGKVIYLTFDDGPSNVTDQMLSILNEEGVKATFFVINKSDNLNYLIKKEYDTGHTVALHSYTHNYKHIYASIDNYFNDLNGINNKVLSITGIKSNIIRFPGGSSNTVSKFNPGIMTNLTTLVKEKGFVYFDWNVDSMDAGSAKTSDDVYRNVISNLDKNNNVVLLHDFENNNKTLNALRDIIKYGKNNGYKFSNITSATEPIVHSVNN